MLSGPAGGAVGAGLLARLSGDGNALGFDMGGTSCDVCVVEDGRVRKTDSRELDGRVIQLPMVDVHTVGAGGGSIGWRDAGGALRVGPRSAGAEPGPACYGRGGTEPTVTDANLALGYLGASSTLAGGIELDAEASGRAIDALAGELGLDPVDAAEGVVRIANQEMVRALRVVTVERGIDPRRFALMPFGGAGPMHAAAIAAELGIERILCPRASGVLSALGLLASERRRDTARTVMLRGEALSAERIADEVTALRESLAEGLGEAKAEITYELRYRGQAFELPVEAGERPEPEELAEGFAAEHERRYGYRDPEAEVELVNVRLALVEPGPRAPSPSRGGRGAPARPPPGAVRRRVAGGGGAARRPGRRDRGRGPVRVRAAGGDAGAAAGLAGEGRRGRDRVRGASRMSAERRPDEARLDPISLQVLVGALRAACDEMGAVLIRSAHSPNIKERHDCSTALFDAGGELVMQAEHIPVHLGSMPDAVAAVLDREQRPDEAWILNDPYAGGTHLPDVTLISPLFDGERLIGFAASRAHHADIGGPTPGGMPADSTRLDEEGVVIPPTRASDEALRELAERMRNPAERLADLRAQRAANLTGARRVAELVERLGRDDLLAGMSEILDYAERRSRAAIADLPDGEYHASDVLEGGADGDADVVLEVMATIDGDAAAARLRRQRRRGRGQPQLPAGGDQVGGLLRRAGAHRP